MTIYTTEAQKAADVARLEREIAEDTAALEAQCEAMAGALGGLCDALVDPESSELEIGQLFEIARAALAQHKGDA